MADDQAVVAEARPTVASRRNKFLQEFLIVVFST
jgi:hypothetical protein